MFLKSPKGSVSFIYYKKQIVLNRGIRYNSLLLINMFYDILTSVFLEEGKKKEHEVQSI